MRWSIHTASIVAAIALLSPPAEARRPRSRAPVVAPTPPTPPTAPGHADAPAPPAPPAAVIAGDPPAPPMPPGVRAFTFHPGRARLGVTATSMTDELRGFFGARAGAGILVQGVATGTTAERAGVRVGDVIIAVDGDAIADVGDVARALDDRGRGDRVEIEVVRDRKARRLVGEIQDDASARAPTWRGGDLHIEGLPPEALRFFGGAEGDEALREQLDALGARLDRLERQLDGGGARRKSDATRPTPPRRAPKRAPRPAADHT